ncbi:MAG: DUF4332 domain-containing protein [Candidatus Heimdallarchaeota archaeon]|nr:DUF4332 domain-containing protein [Candidatus Heimdallarchaeota archaeon]
MLQEEDFRKFLKRKGKKPDVVERNVLAVKKFRSYLFEERKKKLDEATSEDIIVYVETIEKEKKQSAKGSLYVLMNYFNFINDETLLSVTRDLREERTKKSRTIFPIREFLNINPSYVKKLEEIGIKNVEQMLHSGKTVKQRKALSEQLAIPKEKILELVQLSDITRMGYVKTKLSRLYYDSGLDSPLKVAKFEPEELYKHFKKFIEETGWDGMIPNPKDLVWNIKNAKSLKQIVEYKK